MPVESTMTTVGIAVYPLPGVLISTLVITPPSTTTLLIVAAFVYPPPDNATVGLLLYPLPPLLIIIDVTPLEIVCTLSAVAPRPVVV